MKTKMIEICVWMDEDGDYAVAGGSCLRGREELSIAAEAGYVRDVDVVAKNDYAKASPFFVEVEVPILPQAEDVTKVAEMGIVHIKRPDGEVIDLTSKSFSTADLARLSNFAKFQLLCALFLDLEPVVTSGMGAFSLHEKMREMEAENLKLKAQLEAK